MKTATTILATGLMALVSAAGAASPPASLVMIPPQINYQGRLMTPGSVPYNDTNHVIDLTLYPTAATTNKLWSERYNVLTKDGYFSINMGAGGQPLYPSTATNLPVWQVMWKANPADPDTIYLALTVRTDPNGALSSSPIEATPRQQFLTTPFAYRAHQSVYATKADGLFDASQGVQTSSLLGPTTNNVIAVNANVRIGGTNTLYVNKVQASTPSTFQLLNVGKPLWLGVRNEWDGTTLVDTDTASEVRVGGFRNTEWGYPGTDWLNLGGNSVNIDSTNLTFLNSPMFVRKSVTVAASTTSALTTVAHGLATTEYDVCVVGWYYNQTSPYMRSAYVTPGSATASVYFTANPTGGTVTLYFLGIRKFASKSL